MLFISLQSNLSILDTLGPNNTILIMEVSLFQRFINRHLYCVGTASVLIIEVSTIAGLSVLTACECLFTVVCVYVCISLDIWQSVV